jgi:predicted Fe-S protein YdhL (DUF1289 family)
MAECLHKIWWAITGIDHDGKVTERCRGCGVTRRVWGNWERMEDAGEISVNYRAEGDRSMARKQYGYYNRIKAEILKELAVSGEEPTRKKFHIKHSTWLSCKERWKILEFDPAHVTDNSTGKPIAGVVAAVDGKQVAVSDKKGHFLMKDKKVKFEKAVKNYIPMKHDKNSMGPAGRQCPCEEMLRLQGYVQALQGIKVMIFPCGAKD